MLSPQCQKLTDYLKAAQQALQAQLAIEYPAGMRIMVMLSGTQRIPTPAVVTGQWVNAHGGYIGIQIDTAKPRSRQRYRSISLTQIV